MKNTKSALLFAFTIFLASACATNYEEEKSVLLSKPESTDLVNQFDAEKQQEEIYKADQKEAVEVKKTNGKPKAAKPAPKKADAAPAKTPAAVSAKVTVGKAPAFPADYPEEYKAYDAKSKEAWSKFNPIFYQGEQSIMAVTYLGVTAGYITIMSKEVVTLNGKQAFHYFARFKSSDSYRYFYWLDDRLDTYVEKETFLPMKYSLIQREKKQNVDDLQLFDFKKMMTYNWYKRVKEGSNKDEKGEAKIPSLAQDSFSALQFVRGLPLNKGDKYEFPVITRGKFWILKVEVMGEETTTVNGKDTQAIKIKAETNFPGVLKKSGDINFWYGVDAERRLLKFQAKIKLGSLYGELVEYKPGTKVQ
jgi:hypothetical protein